MKKLLLTGLALASFTGAALAQGSINFDASAFNNGITTSDIASGSWYSGTAGIEIWELNNPGSTIANSINSALTGTTAYGLLQSGGFKLEQTFPSVTVNQGGFNLGAVKMADVSPAGSTVLVGIAAWNTADASWAAMLSAAGSGTRAGVIALSEPTADYTQTPAPTPPALVWGVSQDLVMTPVPEPSTFALAGLGAAAMLIFRRRK